MYREIIVNEKNKIHPLNYLRFRYPELIKEIELTVPGKSIKEKLYFIFSELSDVPKCKNKICNNIVKYTGRHNRGYHMYCSTKCSNSSQEVINKAKATNIKLYGAENVLSSNSIIREKIYETCVERYGSKIPIQNTEIHNKIKNTNLNKYGNESHLASKIIKDKIKKTNNIRYGCDRPCQNSNILNKAIRTKFSKIIKYKDTDLYYQGILEKFFLEKCEEVNLLNLISKPKKTFKYELNGRDKLYLPDFFIENKKLIIEIKSKWTFNRNNTNKSLEKQNIKKAEAVTVNGYNYKLLIDKEEIIIFIKEYKNENI